MINPQYTPLYDWVMADKRLTLLDAAIICRVLRWNEFDLDCFESNRKLAHIFNVTERTISRSLKKLNRIEWLAVLNDGYQRIIFVNPDKLKPGPLFENLTEIGEAV